MARKVISNIQQALKYIILAGVVISILYPLVFIIMGSLKDNTQIFTNPFGLPSAPNWHVYYKILVKNRFIVNVGNSLYYSTTTTIFTLMICLLAAYAITRMKWKLNGVFLGMLMVGIMIPGNAMILPLFVLTRKIGLSEPMITLVLVYTAGAIPRTLFILSGFLKSIPRGIEEAAVIDGCNIWQVIFKIVTPVMLPAIATVCIFNFLSTWNDLLMSLIFISESSKMTIQTGLLMFQGIYKTDYGTMLAGVVVTILPVMIIYVLLQKQIIAGMTAGALKG